jgi:hypothetical protein
VEDAAAITLEKITERMRVAARVRAQQLRVGVVGNHR